jgi:hypothetical protein
MYQVSSRNTTLIRMKKLRAKAMLANHLIPLFRPKTKLRVARHVITTMIQT